MKRIKLFFAVLVAAMFAVGCATTTPTSTPTNNDLQQLQAAVDAKLSTKADKADMDAKLEAKGNKIDVESLAGSITTLAGTVTKLANRVGNIETGIKSTSGAVTVLQNALAATNGNLAVLDRSVQATNVRLDKLEKQVVGVRKFTANAVGRLGALEDNFDIDHEKRILRLSGFPSAKLNDKGEIVACAEISKAMQTRIGEIKKIVVTGWKVIGVAGFADDRPFMKDGKVLNNSDTLNAKCAEERAYAVDKAIGTDLGDASINGRGTTTKFGGHDMNRSVLVYLEKTAQAPAAKPVPAPVAPAVAPAAPAAAPAAPAAAPAVTPAPAATPPAKTGP